MPKKIFAPAVVLVSYNVTVIDCENYLREQDGRKYFFNNIGVMGVPFDFIHRSLR